MPAPDDRLARLRGQRRKGGGRLRTLIMESALVACGEKGYRQVTVQDVIDRYGGHRSQFYAHFASKARCFAAAYDFEINRRYTDLLDRTRGAAGWEAALGSVLVGIGEFARRQPMLTRGLVLEVHVAGGEALARRSELLADLSAILDRAGRADRPHGFPPPIASSFLVGAIESALARALARENPEEFIDLAPELVEIASSTFRAEQVEVPAVLELRPV